MTEPPESPSDILAVAWSLRLDRLAVVAIDRLRTIGIPAILLKGAGIATWLYDNGEVRSYRDVDLLVPPAQFEQAKATLAELGYLERLAGADPNEFALNEQELFGPDNSCIDLHHGLIGVSVPEQRLWEILSRHTVLLQIGGGEVPILDIPARSLHLALHAAQNGPVDRKALADLERGVARVGFADWRQAALLARELVAEEAFAAGLRLLPAGETLADRMKLTRRMGVELVLRTRSVPQSAIFFERLAETPGLWRKVALVARKLFPTAAYLKADASKRGRRRFGVLRAWLSHSSAVVRRFGPSLAAWYQARIDTRAEPDHR